MIGYRPTTGPVLLGAAVLSGVVAGVAGVVVLVVALAGRAAGLWGRGDR